MITIKQQFILLELLFHKRLTRKEFHKLNKTLFSIANDSQFFKDIKELKEFGYVETRNYNGNRVFYCLTMNGYAIANILALQNNTDKKFKQIAKSIAWLP